MKTRTGCEPSIRLRAIVPSSPFSSRSGPAGWRMQKLDCTVARAPPARRMMQLPVVVRLDRHAVAGERALGNGEARSACGSLIAATSTAGPSRPVIACKRVDAHVRQRPDLGAEDTGELSES